MKFKSVIALASVFLVSPVSASNELSSDEIKALFTNKTFDIYFQTPLYEYGKIYEATKLGEEAAKRKTGSLFFNSLFFFIGDPSGI